jgi:hypothetical protein
MKIAVLTTLSLFVLASCGQTIQARCAAKHEGDTAAAAKCVKIVENRILTNPGSAFAKNQRGGPG